MGHFKPDRESLCDVNYTPRFYCNLCGSAKPAVCRSEHIDGEGVMRVLECSACHCQERVYIKLSEDCSGWVLFQNEEPTPEVSHEGDPSQD